jgi:hypothetical protein
MNEPEKMSEKKLVKFPPSLMGRLSLAVARDGEDANDIIRQALVAELNRRDQLAGVESQRMDKLRRIAQARGGDVDAVLERMLREVEEPSLPLSGVPS